MTMNREDVRKFAELLTSETQSQNIVLIVTLLTHLRRTFLLHWNRKRINVNSWVTLDSGRYMAKDTGAVGEFGIAYSEKH